MKTILKTFLLLSCISINAQITPLLDYNWTIEKIVTDEETIIADTNFFGEYEVMYFDTYASNNSITLPTSQFAQGQYVVNLIANGVILDAKHLLINQN